MADSSGFGSRYPSFPRIPQAVATAGSAFNMLWDSIARWANESTRAFEQRDALSIFFVSKDGDSSISVVGRINVGDTASSVAAKAGDIRYNTSTNKHQGYNGSTWNDMY